jgi:hypothetical protein
MRRADMTEPVIKKPRKAYTGRRAILNLILSKSDSTKRWLLRKLEHQVQIKAQSQKKLRALAKSMGVRITKLELK